MKRLLLIALAAVLMVQIFAGTSQADLFNISQKGTWPNGINLDHRYLFWMDIDTSSQGIANKLQNGWIVNKAFITFVGLREVTYDADNIIFLGFADAKPQTGGQQVVAGSNLYSWLDNVYNNVINNDLLGQQAVGTFVNLGSYSDPNYALGPYHAGQTVSRILDSSGIAALTAGIVNDGIFSLALDPDCHFVVDDIVTSFDMYDPNAVPEPSSLLLLGSGLVGLGFFSRRRK